MEDLSETQRRIAGLLRDLLDYLPRSADLFTLIAAEIRAYLRFGPLEFFMDSLPYWRKIGYLELRAAAKLVDSRSASSWSMNRTASIGILQQGREHPDYLSALHPGSRRVDRIYWH